jgi:hypothetical protein
MTVKEALEVLKQMPLDTQVKLVFTDNDTQSYSNNSNGDYNGGYSMSRPYE